MFLVKNPVAHLAFSNCEWDEIVETVSFVYIEIMLEKRVTLTR